MPNDFFTLEGIEYSKEDIAKALECLSLNNRTNYKSNNNGEEYSILYKDNRYSVKLIYEQMKINKNLPYENTLGSTSIRKIFSKYYEVLPCIHSNNINRLKDEYQKYLNEIYPAGYDKTYECDPFYLINDSKNTDIKACCKDRNIYFWKIFENDKNLQTYYDVFKEKRHSNTYNSYISSTNKLKDFFIKKYGSYIDWIKSLNEINYYVVSQREHYEEAKQKGIIFSSAKAEHRRMRYLKPNDIILSYVDGINAKLTVLEEPSIDEVLNYIEVKVKFEELKTPISREEIRYRLGDLYNYLTQKEYPFAKNKNEKICSIKQRGFIFNFTEEAYNLLFCSKHSKNTYNLGDSCHMDTNSKLIQPKNQILYGPPGTGKTYNTVIKAMEIINDKKYDSVDDELYKDLKKQFDNLKKQGQIEFVTFHQSYSYEEFVEGIKPDLENENDLKYKLKNGIFKRICNIATRDLYSLKEDEHINFDKIYHMFQEKYESGSSFSNLMNIKYEQNNLIYHFGAQSQDRRIDLKKIKKIFNSDKQYATASEFNKDYQGNTALKGYFFNFYQELMQIKNDYIDENKIDNNINNDASNYVLIIDEINRGNISKIFGELITLIEEDKRGTLSVKLPYSQDDFTVPKNLYILGTMNTSDRSIASIDIALRRRFKFIEMMPKPEILVDENNQPLMVDNISLKELLQKLNDRISYLLDRDHQIGHSYFMNWKNYDMATLKDVWFDEIMPLLNEYFYSDWEKLQAILGGKNDKNNNDKKFFIIKLEKPNLPYDIDCYEEAVYYNFVKKEAVDETDFRTMLENAKLIKAKSNDTNEKNEQAGAD